MRGVLAVALLCFSLAACGRRPDLPRLAQVPEFALRDQRDQPASPADLRGQIWIANFMFTSCPDVCPILTSKLSGVRMRLHGDRVMAKYVSFSVDPVTDTPAVLAKYVAEHHVDYDDWRFLTGPLEPVEQVIIKGFKQALQREPGEPGKPQNIMHGSHFVLVDRALSIRGFYPSDEEGLLRLARDARILWLEKNEVITSYVLATLNALLNTTSAVCIAFGFVAIKRKQRERHRRFMLAAFTASCLFLTSYLTRIIVFGDHKFAGTGALRIFYLALLISHVLLALAAAPMVITTLTLGLRGRFATHRKLAKVTLPIWAYVSVTGVVVYLFLYHL